MASSSSPSSSCHHSFCVRVLLLLLACLVLAASPSSASRWSWMPVGRGNKNGHDYADALAKSILFFEGQRSGRLPPDQRATWRGDSGESDGGGDVDLEGGYYDAGDNVKFGFPMAFTATMLSWSVIEFGDLMPPAERQHAVGAVRWATDYLLKTIAHPGVLFVQVGDPWKDHECWERPEGMDTLRTVYNVTAPRPGSDVAGETAAALAAASIVFRGDGDEEYAERLLAGAKTAFEFASAYKGAYSDDPELRAGGCPFYCDYNGYQDELLWGAAWLRRASRDDTFLKYIKDNAKILGAEEGFNEFGWDNKHAGLNILVSKEFMDGNALSMQSFKESADNFMCTLIPESSSQHIRYTPGGLIYKTGGSNMQHVTSFSFLLLTYANYLSNSSHTVNCGGISVGPVTLQLQAKKQIDYILGDNPIKMSYMVGYGDRYPQRIHHRGSSVPSIKTHPERMACKDGTPYYESSNSNPNPLIGAVVGGPGEDDSYEDARADFRKSEPTTYINAPLVGVLAYFVANPNPGHIRH